MIRLRNQIRGTLPASEIQKAYEKVFGKVGWWQRLFQGQPYQFADQYYQPVNETLIKLILDNDNTNLQHYVSEDFDCDDFTFRLMGIFSQNTETAAMPIFIIWLLLPDGQGHAMISYVTNNGIVKLIEPQNDQIFSVPKDWKLMLLVG